MNDVTVYPTHCFILHFLLVAYETFGGNRVSVYKRKTSDLSPLSPPSADLWNSLSKKRTHHVCCLRVGLMGGVIDSSTRKRNVG